MKWKKEVLKLKNNNYEKDKKIIDIYATIETIKLALKDLESLVKELDKE